MNILKEKYQLIFPVLNGTISQPDARTLQLFPHSVGEDAIDDVGGDMGEASEPAIDSESEREDFDSLEDVWTVTERCVVRHHRKPRVS